ncbi:MAG: patatin, partial [Dietzia sp.]
MLGCGGTIGGAWTIAALYALAEQTGLDPRDADVLQGTSAGAELVTM